jgi:hypothetical protein
MEAGACKRFFVCGFPGVSRLGKGAQPQAKLCDPSRIKRRGRPVCLMGVRWWASPPKDSAHPTCCCDNRLSVVSNMQRDSVVSPCLERGRILQDQQDFEEIYGMGFKMEVAESLQACWHGRGRVQEPFIFCLPGAAREYTLAPGYGLFAPSGRRLKIWGRWAADGSPSHTAVS